MENIVVIGSSSIDLVVKTDVLPQAGETVMGNSFLQLLVAKVLIRLLQQLV